MVLIMTMTPLHMAHHGHGLEGDRDRDQRPCLRDVRAVSRLRPPDGPIGSQPVIAAGLRTWPVRRSSRRSPRPKVAPAPGRVGPGRVRLEPRVRGRVRAADDGPDAPGTDQAPGPDRCAHLEFGWAASLASGVVVAMAGYTTLGLLGAALVIVPIWLVFHRRAATGAPPADGQSRWIGRVRHVGPPEPFRPISRRRTRAPRSRPPPSSRRSLDCLRPR